MSKAREISELGRIITVDANGKIGVGTSAPDYKLDIVGATAAFKLSAANVYADWEDGTNSSRLQQAGNSFNIGTVTSGALVFKTDNAERARIDYLGRVGIGTSSPSFKIHAVESAAIGIMASNNDAMDYYCAIGATASAGHVTAGSSTSMSVPMIFKTANGGTEAESMRIDPNGRLLHGTTNTGPALYGASTAIKGIALDHEAYLTICRDGTPLLINRPTTTGIVASWHQAGTQVGTVTVSSTATAYNTSSDYRLKFDAEAPADSDPETKLRSLANAQRWYGWNADPNKIELGWYAHELAEIAPEAVTGEKDAVDEEGNPEYQSRDDTKLIPTLVAALDKALQEIDSLKARVSELEGAK